MLAAEAQRENFSAGIESLQKWTPIHGRSPWTMSGTTPAESSAPPLQLGASAREDALSRVLGLSSAEESKAYAVPAR